MITTTVTQKGQATIPALFRKRLGIRLGEKVIFEERDQEIVIRPVVNPANLRGSLKSTKKYDEKKIFKSVGKMLGKRLWQK